MKTIAAVLAFIATFALIGVAQSSSAHLTQPSTLQTVALMVRGMT